MTGINLTPAHCTGNSWQKILESRLYPKLVKKRFYTLVRLKSGVAQNYWRALLTAAESATRA